MALLLPHSLYPPPLLMLREGVMGMGSGGCSSLPDKLRLLPAYRRRDPDIPRDDRRVLKPYGRPV